MMLIQNDKITKKRVLLEVLINRAKRGSLIITKEDKLLTTPETIGKTIENLFFNKHIALEGFQNIVGTTPILNGGRVLNDILVFMEGNVSTVSDNDDFNGLLFDDLSNRDVNFMMETEVALSYFDPGADFNHVKRVLDTNYRADYLSDFALSELKEF